MSKISQVYAVKNQPLNLETVTHIFNNIDADKLSTVAPIKPKGSEIYVYKILKYQKKEFWKDDHYRWQCKGRKLIPRKNPVFKKYYFDIRLRQQTSAEFQRHAYYAILMDNMPYVVVHYLGEHTKVADAMFFPEPTPEMLGYCKVLPGFLQEAFYRYASGAPGSYTDDNEDMTYTVMIDPNSSGPSHIPMVDSNGTITAASEETVETSSYTMAQQSEMASSSEVPSALPLTVGKELPVDKTSIYNVYQIANSFKDFIWKMDLFPEILIIGGAKQLVDEVNKVIHFQSPLPQILSYDEKYQVGDFYISPILIRHTAFDGGPAIPALFLIHEVKDDKNRDEIFPYVNNLLSSLNEVKHPLITYRDRRIVSAVRKHLPHLPIWHSWDTVLSDVKKWLFQNNVEEVDFPAYLETLQDLFDSESYEEYQSKINECKHLWPESFKKYYFRKIHPDINIHLGAWLFMSHGVYSPYSGVMTNKSHNFEQVIKCLQKWRNVPLDTILHSLWYLQVYMYEAIQMSYAGKGIFNLIPNLTKVKYEASAGDFQTRNTSLEEVIEEICNGKHLIEDIDDDRNLVEHYNFE